MSRMGPREPVELRVTGSLSVNDLMWVANTIHGPAAHWHARPRGDASDHDHLADAADARRYLADHGVPVPPGAAPPDAVAGLRAVRDTVHRLIDARGDAWTRETDAILERADYGIDASGRMVARGEGWAAFVADLVPALLVVTDRRERLGKCGNPACRLAFLDDTRNGARRWCDPGGCGNRIRVRRARSDPGRRGSTAALRPTPQPPR